MGQHAVSMGRRKKIALVAHDNKKADLLAWARFNRDLLARHDLFATGTTGSIIVESLQLDVGARARPAPLSRHRMYR